MASFIDASTNSGLVSSSDGTSALQLRTYNKPALSIDASQALTINGSASVPSGSVFTSIKTPLVNTSGTLTLASNSIIGATLDTSQTLSFNSGFGSVSPAYGCRAWVNFYWNGSAVVVRASGGVSSVQYSSTGIYVISFSNQMPDSGYVVLGNAAQYGTAAGAASVGIVSESAYASNNIQRDQNDCAICIADNNSDTLVDPFSCNVAFFR